MSENMHANNDIIFIDISAVCRLCLASDDLMMLVKSEELEDFRSSINIELLLDDEYPKKICTNCSSQLMQTAKFLGQCRLAQSVLLGIVEVNENNQDHHCQTDYKQNVSESVDATATDKIGVESKVETVVETEHSKGSQLDCIKTCNVCGAETLSLLKHRKANVRCRSKCTECQFSHWNLSILRTHKQNIHSQKSTYCCPICQKSLKYKHSLDRHVKIHQFGEQFSCKECDKKFTTKIGLQQHTNRHTGDKTFKCRMCNESFSSIRTRYLHMETIHNIIRPVKWIRIKKETNTGTNKRTCNTKATRKLPILCSTCGKSYTNVSSYYAHINNIHNSVRYMCDKCPFKTGLPGVLTVHMRTHTGERPYKCNFCPKRFKQQSHRSSHHKIHNNIKNFSCSVCQKAFHIKANLAEHELRHKGVTPFICHVCDKGFYSSSARKKHVFTMHGKDEVDNIRKHPWRTTPSKTES